MDRIVRTSLTYRRGATTSSRRLHQRARRRPSLAGRQLLANPCRYEAQRDATGAGDRCRRRSLNPDIRSKVFDTPTASLNPVGALGQHGLELSTTSLMPTALGTCRTTGVRTGASGSLNERSRKMRVHQRLRCRFYSISEGNGTMFKPLPPLYRHVRDEQGSTIAMVSPHERCLGEHTTNRRLETMLRSRCSPRGLLRRLVSANAPPDF